MISVQTYILEKLFIIIVGNLSCTFSFGVTNHAAAFLMRKKVGLLRLVLGTLLMSLIFNGLLFAVEYLFYYPRVLDLNAYGVFIFPNPLLLPVYYWIFRRIFGFTDTEGILALEGVMLGQSMTMLMYMAFTDVWIAIFDAASIWPYAMHTDVMAMVTTDVAVVGMYFLLRWVVIQRGYYWEIPYNYVLDNPIRRLRSIFFSVTGSYLLLMASCIFVISDYRSILDLSRTVLYLILAVVLGARLLNELRKVRLGIVEMEAKATSAYIDSLMRATNDFRGIKHDINNILQVYEGYIVAGDLDGLRAYHEWVMRTTQQINDSLALIEALRPRMAVYNLLNLKIGLAQSVGVCVAVEGAEVLREVGMGDLDLCSVLGDLLDNAVEVAEASEERTVKLACSEGDGSVRVLVCNSVDACVGCEGEPCHAGVSLKTARDTVAHYEGCRIEVKCEAGFFCTYVSLQPHA